MLFIFGEAEKGPFCRPVLCKEPLELFNQFGHAPQESYGLILALQSIFYQRPVLFFRVEEEGYSLNDYYKGLELLQTDWDSIPIQGIALPGVSNLEIIEKTERFIFKKRSLFLMNEKDFFDFLTN